MDLTDACLGLLLYLALLHPASARVDGRSRPGKGSGGRPRYLQMLLDLAGSDPTTALLEYIEYTRPDATNCSSAHLAQFGYTLPADAYARFSDEESVAVRTANVFNNLFSVARGPTHNVDYNDAFYYSLARATVQGGGGVVYGSAIAFDVGQYSDERRQFCPYVYARDGRYYAKNLEVVSKGKRALNETAACRWFLNQRSADYSQLLWQHKDVCKRQMDSADAARRMNVSTVVTTPRQGQWTQPYVDCDGARAWVVTYSVPFFGCTRLNTLSFK